MEQAKYNTAMRITEQEDKSIYCKGQQIVPSRVI